jgi:hypothetical protein
MSELEKSAEQVNQQISELLAAESKIEAGYSRLGTLLYEVSVKKYWQPLGYHSFGKYMEAISEKHNKSRSQLYNYFSTVREISPYINQEQMIEIGIAKAAKLAKSIKKTGFPPSQETINYALDSKVTAQDFTRILFEDDLETPPPGEWYSQEGFYVSPEEKLVIESAEEAAARVDPALKPDIPDHVRRKEIRLRLSMEFLSTHA